MKASNLAWYVCPAPPFVACDITPSDLKARERIRHEASPFKLLRRVLGCVLLALLANVSVYSQTEVSGGIYANTTWTKANSPYVVVDTIVIFPNVTLTIEPGTEVRFGSATTIDVRGRLQAHGTAADSIVMRSSGGSEGRNDWQGIVVGRKGSIDLDYCSISNATLLFDLREAYFGEHRIARSRMHYNNEVLAKEGYGTSKPNMTVSGCIFEQNRLVSSRCVMARFDSCTFRHNEIAIEQTYDQEITHCTFTDHSRYALGMAAGRIENCTFSRNGIAVHCWFGDDYVFRNNVVTENAIGLILMGAQAGHTSVIVGNVICGNTTYNVKNGKSENFNLAGNCWCSTDSASVRSTVLDGYSDVALGLVEFLPFGDNVGPCDTSPGMSSGVATSAPDEQMKLNLR